MMNGPLKENMSRNVSSFPAAVTLSRLATKEGIHLLVSMSASTICFHAFHKFSRLYRSLLHLIGGMALSPDESTLAVGEGNYLHIWQFKKEKIQTDTPSPGHTQRVKAMSFGACGNLLATIAQDGSLRLWDLDGSKPRERLLHKEKYGTSWEHRRAFLDATRLATGFQMGGFTLWEISPTGLRSLAEHKSGGKILNFSPDSKLLLSLC